MAITIEPDVPVVNVGDEIEFTVTVVNNGPDTAINTVARVMLPEELRLLDFEPSKGTYDPETGIWEIGELAPGEEVTLLLLTKALAPGKFVVAVTVKCNNVETDYSNNDDDTEVEVIEPMPPIEPDEPVEPDTPSKHSDGGSEPAKMPATGNPIVMVLLSLLAIVGISFKRKK